ncbi:MAG: hypothetical protein ABS949_12185 [Solibacillus sp.]
MGDEIKYPKTKRALRKIKKRQELICRKRYLPAPKNISYTIDDSGELIIVSGDVEKEVRFCETAHFIRFKLSGQKDFSPFGYQAKIPIVNGRFQFEVLQVALLERDFLEIQLINEHKQYSDRVICKYVKVPLVKEVQMDAIEERLASYLSRAEKYRAQKKQ